MNFNYTTMKKTILFIPFLALMACGDHKKETENVKQDLLDSIRSANYTNEVRQRTIDSMNAITSSTPIPVNDNMQNGDIAVTHPKHHQNSHHSTPATNENQTPAGNNTTSTNGNTTPDNNSTANTSTTTSTGKKKMNNKTKDAIIGAGAGVVTGIITGAATSKDKKKGAVIGGIIGGAVGSGVGYGIGSKKDKKEKKDTIK
jgi:hypothetical protein